MAGLLMTITDAGLDALVDAQGGGSDDIQIATLGLTDQIFVQAPTLENLPGQFKVLDSISGEPVSENIIHLTAYDISAETYDVTGFGLFLENGTLFAVYSSSDDPILTKAELAFALFSQDISFDNSTAANITFGNAIFSYPPASKTVKGVAFIADDDEADDSDNETHIMPPLQVHRLIEAYAQSIADKLIPPRCPVAWYPESAVDPVPTGWNLCDGSNGTPDLRDRFVIGAGGDFDVGDAGGSYMHGHDGTVDDHILTVEQMPAHRHFVAVNGEGSDPLTAANSISDITRVNENQEYDLQSLAGEPTIGRTSPTGGGLAHDHGLTIEDATVLPPYYALAYIMKA